MSDEREVVLLHGIRAVLPDGWADHSVYRFAAPPAADDDAFRANLMITRHDGVPDEIPLAQIFTGPNHASKEQHRDFEVLRAGVAPYLEQEAAWQDVRFFDPRAQRLFFQRQLGVRPGPLALVVFTLSSDKSDLDALSAAALGFALPSPHAGRSRAAAAAAAKKRT